MYVLLSSTASDRYNGTPAGHPIPQLVLTGVLCPVGGELIPLDTTMVLVAGTHSVASWMIPVLVSAVGIGIVIARKF